ncbi:MAG: PAC2 family protein [Actinobacteria bacterium]|nr:PAC2 family protein [Actinomycetota bacterium]MBU1493464.1 PAC2 family protein [Actinomycetota bacterium]
MDAIRRIARPVLRSPCAVMAFEGWNDASDAASGAATFLLGQVDAEPFAVIEPEDFYDFQAHRPQVVIDQGGTRRLTWPTTGAYAIDLTPQPRDLVVVTGDEPNHRWKTYTRLVAALMAESDVEMVITMGAFIGQVAHTQPVPIVAVATRPELLVEHDLAASSYQGPTGIVGVMLEACREVGIPAVSLWAATPHYLAANPNPMAMLALLDRTAAVAGVNIDTTELAAAAADFQGRVDAALTHDGDFAAYVHELEGESVDEPIDSAYAGGMLVSEIEDYLRDGD